MKDKVLTLTPPRVAESPCATPPSDSHWLRVLPRLPVLGAGLLAVLLFAVPELPVRFGPDDAGVARLLLLVMVTGMAGFAFAIELDIRLARRHGARADDARTSLAFSTCFALALFAVRVGIAAEQEKVQSLEAIVFVCLCVLAICVPLLWFTARTLATGPQRAVLLGGFVVVTAAVEMSFDLEAGNVEERIFTWHSLLIALALALRLGSWGIKEFRA